MIKKVVALVLILCFTFAFAGQVALAAPMCPSCQEGYMSARTVYTAYLPVVPMELRACAHGYSGEVDILYYRKVGTHWVCTCGYTTATTWTSMQYKWVCQH